MKTKAISRSDAIAIYKDVHANYNKLRNWRESRTELINHFMRVFDIKDKNVADSIYSSGRVFQPDNFYGLIEYFDKEDFAKFVLFCKVVRHYIHEILIPNLEHADCDDIIWGFVDEVHGFPQDWRFWGHYELTELKEMAKELGVK